MRAAKRSPGVRASKGDQSLRIRGPRIMGVINLSADSWYRESVCLTSRGGNAARVVLAGARRGYRGYRRGIDPGACRAAGRGDCRTSKLLPVLEGLQELKILISVETYKVGGRAALPGSGREHD